MSISAKNTQSKNGTVVKTILINTMNLQKYPIKKNVGIAKTFDFYPGHNTTEKITFFTGKDMTVGVNIKINDKEGSFWNDSMEVLLDAVYNGYFYRLGLEKYKSERSLELRINNFIKYILADNVV